MAETNQKGIVQCLIIFILDKTCSWILKILHFDNPPLAWRFRCCCFFMFQIAHLFPKAFFVAHFCCILTDAAKDVLQDFSAACTEA